MNERIQISWIRPQSFPPHQYMPDQVDSTLDEKTSDYVWDSHTNCTASVRWSEDVPAQERHEVMRNLVALCDMRGSCREEPEEP